MTDDLIGTRLGQYEIRSVLGEGGMSTVYLGYQSAMDRLVAIKVLPREFLHDATFLQRFQQEARTIARLEHINILPVYDVGEDQGLPYIVMRYLTGGTLGDLINQRLPDNDTINRILSQVASALDHAHARGIIHRDIKPSNVLLDSAGNAYLADFGISRIAQESSGLTGSRIVGTPSYIAPEMVRKGEPITGSVDIYALGILAYEMLAGEAPYHDEDPMKTLMAHVLEPVPSIRSVDPNVSPRVDAVVQKALAKRPEDRYPTATAFAEAFSQAIGTEIAPATTPRPIEPAPPPIIPPRPGSNVPRPATPRPRQRGFSFPAWIMLPAVLMAMGLGVLVVAYVLTDGDFDRLFILFQPGPTRTPRPTVTVTPGGAASTDVPVLTARPEVLPAPSGGDRLAFASNRTGNFDVYLIDIDGNNLSQLTTSEGPDFDPAWSHDGNEIVYSSREDRTGPANLWIMLANGTEQRQITDSESDNTDPDWSPDGQWIVFSSNRDGDFELYRLRPDGTNLQQLTFNEGLDDLTPRWSSDGTLIGYHQKTGSSSATSDLFMIDGGANEDSAPVPNQITDNDVIDQWIDWAPDSLRIAFTSGDGLGEGQRAIFILNLPTGERYQATDGQISDDDPAWSPDGTRLAFDSNREGNGVFDLYILTIPTNSLFRLTANVGDNVAPAWQPR